MAAAFAGDMSHPDNIIFDISSESGRHRRHRPQRAHGGPAALVKAP